MEGMKITINIEEYNAYRDVFLRAKIARNLLDYVEVSMYDETAKTMLDAAIRTLDPDYTASAGEEAEE